MTIAITDVVCERGHIARVHGRNGCMHVMAMSAFNGNGLYCECGQTESEVLEQ